MPETTLSHEATPVITTTFAGYNKTCHTVVDLSRNLMRYLWQGTPTDFSFIDRETSMVRIHNDMRAMEVSNLTDPLSEHAACTTRRILTNERYHATPLSDDLYLVTLHCTADPQEDESGENPYKVCATMIWHAPSNDAADPTGNSSIGETRLRLCQVAVDEDLPTAADVAADEDTRDKSLAEAPQSTRPLVLQASDTKGTTHWVAPAQIMYVAAAHQYTNVYCVDRTVRMRASLGSILEQLAGTVVRVHRSYAVNPIYVSRLAGETLYLVNGAKLPVPAKRVKDVRLMLAQYCEKLGTR